jgi:hypothetical protein
VILMRNVIFGGIGVLWGGGILLYTFLAGGARSGGAFGAGQVAGLVFGLLLFGVGLFYLINGIRDVSAADEDTKPRRRKQGRRDH